MIHHCVESGDQCLLSSEVLSCFSGVIISVRSFFSIFRELDGFLCWWIFGPRGNLETCVFQQHTYLNLTTLNMDGNIEKSAPSTARRKGRMSSCKRATGARSRPRTKASAATRTSSFNICPGIICSCGKMCKDFRGLKLHQAKTKCQMPENTLKAPFKTCFVSLNDVILSSCLSFEDKIYYQTSTKTFIPVSNVRKPDASKKGFVKTTDKVISSLSDSLNNDISPYGKKSCQTCNQFISNQSFKSNLTGKEYKTTTYDKLSCGSSNIIYGMHCIHCDLVYVGETGRSLRSRLNDHRSAIKKEGQSLLHRHFHQSVDSLRVQILEKLYHSSGSPSLSTPLRRELELCWIKELGTAKPYGFNDQIKGVGTLSSTSCKKTNVYTLSNKHQRRKRSHGKRHYNKKAPQPECSIDTLITLIDMIDQPEGFHKIKTHLIQFHLPDFPLHKR